MLRLPRRNDFCRANLPSVGNGSRPLRRAKGLAGGWGGQSFPPVGEAGSIAHSQHGPTNDGENAHQLRRTTKTVSSSPISFCHKTSHRFLELDGLFELQCMTAFLEQDQLSVWYELRHGERVFGAEDCRVAPRQH